MSLLDTGGSREQYGDLNRLLLLSPAVCFSNFTLTDGADDHDVHLRHSDVVFPLRQSQLTDTLIKVTILAKC